jgi:alpha-tubulin suppressor-like RCC1 family protein
MMPSWVDGGAPGLGGDALLLADAAVDSSADEPDGALQPPLDACAASDCDGGTALPAPNRPRIDFELGFTHSCALGLAGTAWCWGSNGSGEVGDGTTEQRTRPVAVQGLRDLTVIYTGQGRSCAVQKGGKLFCWGAGHGRRPVEVNGFLGPVVGVGIGKHHCALLASGRVMCWGDNVEGQLGDGTKINRTQPVSVIGLEDAVEVGAGVFHSCARRRGGSVVCWGNNRDGRIGDGTQTSRLAPTAVVGLSDAVQLSVGSSQACALRSNGTIGCWGRNFRGELGVSGIRSSSRPVAPMGVKDAVQISVGQHFACARLDDGGVMCWGDNRYGQSGIGIRNPEDDPAQPPQRVKGLSDAVEAEAGGYHVCVTRRSGALVCWGAGSRGQLGMGNTAHLSLPTAFTGL